MKIPQKIIKIFFLIVILILCTLIIFSLIILQIESKIADINSKKTMATTTTIGSGSYVSINDHNKEMSDSYNNEINALDISGKTVSFVLGAEHLDSVNDGNPTSTSISIYCPNGCTISRGGSNVNLTFNVYGSTTSGTQTCYASSNGGFNITVDKYHPYIRIICDSRDGRGMTCEQISVTYL